MRQSELLEHLKELTEKVLGFMKLLRTTPEELTEEERKEVQAGCDEFARGEWGIETTQHG